jgi:hypothetical protein
LKLAMNFCPLTNSRSRRRAALDRFNRPARQATQSLEVADADIVASRRTLSQFCVAAFIVGSWFEQQA